MVSSDRPAPARPHLLGVDDAPFEKHAGRPVPLVAAMLEGAGPLEFVALDRFPEDGDDAAVHLARWIGGLRCREALHAVLLGGITLAGLGVVDVAGLSRSLSLPVLVVTRRPPDDGPLVAALESAGLVERVPLVRRAPRAVEADAGCWVAQAGTTDAWAAAVVRASRTKSRLPEPLRVAHLIAAALADGQSHGRA